MNKLYNYLKHDHKLYNKTISNIIMQNNIHQTSKISVIDIENYTLLSIAIFHEQIIQLFET